MEPVIVIVGFLGAGKTTLLRRLVKEYLESDWQPYIIINDYENAHIDSQRFLEFLKPNQIQALSGSCICCSGLSELREQLNSIPKREKGITFIEANGTSDACSLMEFLGVGLKSQFLPPIQISVVDAKNWQHRNIHNDLEANQVQVSSLVTLSHTENLSVHHIDEVKNDVSKLNPSACIEAWEDIDSMKIPNLHTSPNKAQNMNHNLSHWSSCSVDLPDPMSSMRLFKIIESLPKGILRVKGCTRLDNDTEYSYFEKTPSGEATVRPYRGKLVSGPKLLVVGPGSDPQNLNKLINDIQ